jgi:SM-20-related protein
MDLLHVTEFLSDAELAALVEAVRGAPAANANLLGRDGSSVDDSRVRRTSRVEIPEDARALLRERLEELRAPFAEHYRTALAGFEDPQCLRYGPGDHFVAHQDGNTPLVHDDSRHRRVSAVLFLVPRTEEPAEGTYGGGSLLIHAPWPSGERVAAPADPGGLVAFRSETTHEVTPVTHGERFTIVTWFRGPG